MNYLAEHKPHFGVNYFVKFSEVGPGDVITFDYKTKPRWAFVLDPNYDGKMHALTLELTPFSVIKEQVVDAMHDTDIPQDLYESEVYKIAKNFDSYRTYFVNEIKKPRRIPYYLTPKPILKR